MAPPPEKKIKLDPEPKKPIIFTTPGIEPDVALHVFNQEFLVYSGLLKIHSDFFRKFLEPCGGKLPTSTSPFITSQWFTKIDEDCLSWSLTSDVEV
jgi:hypothetical protein